MKRTCNICGSRLGDPVLELGEQPCADRFLSESDLKTDPNKIYSLSICVCDECLHVQTERYVDPKERYCEIDYSFIASSSNFAKKHWDEFFKSITAFIGHVPDRVLEVGSNDGYLLKNFKEAGSYVVGVDASPNMVGLAKETHFVNSIQGFFSRKLLDRSGIDSGFDLIVANNVVNHIDDFNEFFRTLNRELKDDGLFVFEVPLWTANVMKHQFDTIYHEHVNYFTFTSLYTLLRKHGLSIIYSDFVEYHGQSVRIYVKRAGKEKEWQYLQNRIKSEETIFDGKTYKEFQSGIVKIIKEFNKVIDDHIKDGYAIIGIGAAAKGNTFLNTMKLGDRVSMITDASPTKIGKYTAYTHIPIKTDNDISEYDKVLAIVLTDNLPETIRNIIKKLNPNTDIKFIETPNAI